MYELLIHPDLTPGGEGRFTGSEKIFLDISEPTDIIVLHSHELNISKVEFTALNSNVQVSVRLTVEIKSTKLKTLFAELSIGHRVRTTSNRAE